MTEVVAKPKIIIVGGGFGGYFSARYLQKKLGQQADIELISQINYFVFQPLLPEVAAGTLNAEDAVTSLRSLLKGLRVRLADVVQVDLQQRQIVLLQGRKRLYQRLNYDHLIIATGQNTNLRLFPGFEHHSLTMKNLADAYRLRNQVIESMELADVTRFDDIKACALTFVIAGGGFSGVETAGEMVEMIERILPNYPNVKREEVRVVLIQRGERILPEMPEKLSDYALRHLQKQGVDVWLNTSIQSATQYAVRCDDGRVIPAQTIVTTIGNAPSDFVLSLSLPLERGKIQVEPSLQVKGHDNVWSLGDVALVPLTDDEGSRNDGQQYAPPTAQCARQQARYLAANIAASLSAKPLKSFAYQAKGSLASLGGYRGVAEVYGLALTGLPAWLLWRALYIGMLPGLGTRIRVGLNWIYDYLMPRKVVNISQSEQTATRYLHYAAGDCAQHTDEKPAGFYVVVEGRLEQRVRQADGSMAIYELMPGDSWGSKALKEERLTLTEIIALEDSTVLLVDDEDFLRLRKVYKPLDKQLDAVGR